MSAGQVVQLFTPGTSDNDTLSGTEIWSPDDKPVQVLSGVGCVNIFNDETPCGHIEDAVLPLEVLGKDYIVPVLTSNGGADGGVPIAQTIRVQSISDGTAITFEPKVLTAVTLSRGEAAEYTNVTANVRISSPTPFAVTQFSAGSGVVSRQPVIVGSPNQLAVVPLAQFRTAYSFVVSPQFTTNSVVITAPTGTAVLLDGQPVPSEKFIPVGASGMSIARLVVTQANRVHAVSSDKPVGIVIHGIAPYASYAYPGGLDLRRPGARILR
jgi:hypothetical protein